MIQKKYWMQSMRKITKRMSKLKVRLLQLVSGKSIFKLLFLLFVQLTSQALQNGCKVAMLGSRRPKWNDFKDSVLICTIEHCNKNNKPSKYFLSYGHNICIEADLSVRSSFCENKITMPSYSFSK